MNETSLSSLYRRLTAAPSSGLDAETLADAADGSLPADRRETVAASIAASSAEADLVRMLAALKSDSEALAADVSRTQREALTHRRHARVERRVAMGRRTGVQRWASALAACLVAVVGVFTLRHAAIEHAPAAKHTVAHADTIFNSRDEIFSFGMDGRDEKARKDGDQLFRNNFNGDG